MEFQFFPLVLCLVLLSANVLSEKFQSNGEILGEKYFYTGYENYGAEKHKLEPWFSDNEGKLNADMPPCNKTPSVLGLFNLLNVGAELACLEECTEGRTCKDGYKCLYLQILFENKCVQTCSADDDCEYPKICTKLPKYKMLENKFCFWKECKVQADCEYPLQCFSTPFGKKCARRYCTYECKDREKCNLVGRGCECADGMSGNNCANEAWCKDNGKFKDCKGENGTCGYNSELNAVKCSCERFPKKRLHPEENRCRELSNDDSDCANGGVCEKKGENKFCSCKTGIIGDKCEIVFDCTPEGKYKDCENSGGRCSYNGTEATCECFGNKLLNDNEHKCKICECGPHGICKFVKSQKQCDCKKGFLEIDGTCIDCNCRGGECVKEGEKPVCKCPPGYGNFTSDTCKACNCGPNINCIWKGRFGGSKICHCEPGFSTLKGKCVACDCGPDSKCEWISEGWLNPEKKVCYCKQGYHEKNGRCVDKETSKTEGTTESTILSTSVSSSVADKETSITKDTTELTSSSSTVQDLETSTTKSISDSSIFTTSVSSTVPDLQCNCGSFSYSCSFDSGGNKICICFPSYSQLNGSCAECNCGPYGSCMYENGRKKCNCKSFATEINEVCLECNCGPYGTCRYANGRKECNCKPYATEMNGVCVGKQDVENLRKLPKH